MSMQSSIGGRIRNYSQINDCPIRPTSSSVLRRCKWKGHIERGLPGNTEIKPKNEKSFKWKSIQSSAAAGSRVSSPDDITRNGGSFSEKYAQRRERLSKLLKLRKVYSDILHAHAILASPSPAYKPFQDKKKGNVDVIGEMEVLESISAEEDEKAREVAEQEHRDQALWLLADMKLTSDQLKVGLKNLSQGFGSVFNSAQIDNCEAAVLDTGLKMSNSLRERLATEVQALPFVETQYALALVDAKLSSALKTYSSIDSIVMATIDGRDPTLAAGTSARERLEAAEKVAERFVQKRIKPALRRAQEAELGDLLLSSGSYLKGLWDRLNGGGRRSKLNVLEALGLPVPPSSKKESELAIVQLSMELELLEQKLQEASKTRENKLRRAGLPGRVQMAIELKGLDADVFALSRLLAVRTLQLEMEYVYRSLEDEALDLSGYGNRLGEEAIAEREDLYLELDLLVADYMMLEEELTALAGALDQQGSSISYGRTGTHEQLTDRAAEPDGKLTLGLIGEDVLVKLAVEIPDMRVRVGVVDQMVYGGSGFSLTKMRLQVQDSLDKVQEAIEFMVRGVRLLGADINNSARVFTRAALGGTLKPREVSALRRTARDLLAFVPFTIILIIPLTPLGHVLVFGFIQTYFPSFFPSCFTKKRQEIMVKYEDLQNQLMVAKSQAEQVEEEEELERAAAAVARLTAPETSGTSSSRLQTMAGQALRGASLLTALQTDNSRDASSLSGEKYGHPGVTLTTGKKESMGQSGNAASSSARQESQAAVEPTLGPHLEKVRALEVQMNEVLEVVKLGDGEEEQKLQPAKKNR
ncbi:hypothetical protein CEUSTIGMA_g1340.t1 [Chlamydomonas eustigma]|uniref:Letm1 RBD domain-containing protein n=1 Tax=Chlamydomonas eustigma TaxID=1157962 RepID=A0A250WTN1_9CHLO|nr:hypothetical protein CEUSTIGMA_g1340.t1 [Chlamydomonas eustigma]|eukprot:GAX73890.1 hypothetical protein CEUSTIGMA_g1340.t1 [Chlamydomonas eustigma]